MEETISQQPTSQPMVATWPYGFSQSQGMILLKELQSKSASQVDSVNYKSLPMTARRSFPGEQSFHVVQFKKNRGVPGGSVG